MKAFVITAPGQAEVQEVPDPVAAPGQVVVDVERAGVCGTDAEFFSGHMSYLATGHASFPIRIGHEWCGRVSQTGPGVDETWLGKRVSGDTMLGCGTCPLCSTGRQHLCADRHEIGIRRGWPGALAEKLPVPASALVELPPTVDEVAGALIEPSANALRAVRAAAAGPGTRLLVVGPGAIGLLSAMIARAAGATVSLLGRTPESLKFAVDLGFQHVWTGPDLGAGPFDAVIDASNDHTVPAAAADLVVPGGRLVFIGLSTTPSLLDTRALVLKDVSAVGVLSGSGALAGAAGLMADGTLDARPLVAATVGLDGVAGILAGRRPADATAGPKIHVDPRR
ncbi:zinc-dependent alcohol dehydrogenase [Kineosporia succinea]|uniref:2-desacetyl-2-hydroxyethyl bacteriochlorophyllide A dehydrogenase n=1 Tax=Kineosporia succinea TaxID=84632 RepID=A0ABT9PEH6_9ACTN|nr:alcohol dehydrogenase catalytic domain-containing protein [Kineosporia succinea]MDP9831116.1 2-desacetyl-2-hydroxyethyl bacteriochlorophyllide A dehydrogenase [Kineosporia succinea]